MAGQREAVLVMPLFIYCEAIRAACSLSVSPQVRCPPADDAPIMAPRLMALQPGATLGPYEILSLIGAGGMGEVYRARDTRLDRIVAIKVIIDREGASSVMRERFDREAHAIAQLSHPNICTLHDVGHHEGTAFLVMEYLEGETLAARLARQKPRSSGGSSKAAAAPSPDGPPTPSNVDTGPRTPRSSLPLDETVRIATQLADALTAAHRAGIVHRDLKPGNIMLTRTGVKVLDFGLAKLKPSSSGGVNAPNTTTDLPLTSEGVLVGTIPYMAPEQLEGRAVDSPNRHLRLRRDRLRDGHRSSRVCRGVASEPDRCHSRSRAGANQRRSAAHAARTGAPDTEVPGQGSGYALADRQRHRG